MPRNISKKKSLTEVTLANRRKAKFKDPEGYKNFPKDQLLGLGEAALDALFLKGAGKFKKSLKSGKTFTKKRGGLTNTVPPKRGTNPQGYRKGADVDFYMGGDQNFSYGGGKLSYTYDKSKVLTKKDFLLGSPREINKKKFTAEPYVTFSANKRKKESIKTQLDRIGLDTEYNSKKFNLKTRYSQNASGNKNKQFNADLSYRPNNKISVDLNTDARKSHSARAEFTPTNKTKFNINTDFDKDHNFGFEYKRKNTKLNVKSDANKEHSISAFYRKKNKTVEASYSSRKGLYGQVNVNFKHGGAAGCPHREIGVKSNIKGVSGIQVKGQKFTGSK
tara:strand:- start:1946 stop:2944 length:999 start_codon:yes stop_codon:yes gene_type:complete